MSRIAHLLAVASLAVLAAPAAAQSTFDHGAFDQLLHEHVRDGSVDYAAFDASPEFRAYLGSLAKFDPRKLPREEQLAFWINAYNAYTIRLINKHEERNSIRNINKSALFIKGYGPWNEKLAVVGDSAYGLDDIEQKIIRPEFKEPRIHFALVCAAIGCPPLRSEAYTGRQLEAQLNDQARIFLLKSPAKNRVDVAKRKVYLSEVFKFRDYEKDFGGTEEAIGKFIARFYPAGPERELLEGGKFDVDYTKYDWTLNSREKADLAKGSR
ncbi:MAG: DUF547 domain-containing protein [Gemmatimonadales bacterium]